MTTVGTEPSCRQELTVAAPYRLTHRGVKLGDDARSMGIHIQAGKGSGKSRLMGRVIAPRDFIQGVPQVIFDPNGATIDNFLDALARLVARLAGDGQITREEQEMLWQRVRYVDMSGQSGYVVPFPLYYRLGQESYKDIAWRYLEAILRSDPELKDAPVQGWNAVARLGSRTGMVLSALGCQISEATNLLNQPKAWKKRLQQLAANTPDRGLRMAAEFLINEYTQSKPQERDRAKSALETKLDMFTLDESMLAMFGASQPGIDWGKVAENRQTVLLDFRHEQNSEHRRFKMLWAFLYFLEYIKRRGRGRHQPVGLIIDELTSLYNFDIQAGADIFASDLDELINQIARDFRVWLTLAHQEQFQIDKKSHKTLMTMGTQILGVTSDFESAFAMSQQLLRVDPDKVKRMEMTYLLLSDGCYHLRPTNPVEYTVEEQLYQGAYEFQDLGLFQFLVKPAKAEGDFTGDLIPMSIANLDRGVWNNEALVGALRQRLGKRDGIPIDSLLAQIDRRQGDLDHRLRGRGSQQGVQSAGAYARVESRYDGDEDDFSSLRESKKTQTA